MDFLFDHIEVLHTRSSFCLFGEPTRKKDRQKGIRKKK